jgi:hypothetical protein
MSRYLSIGLGAGLLLGSAVAQQLAPLGPYTAGCDRNPVAPPAPPAAPPPPAAPDGSGTWTQVSAVSDPDKKSEDRVDRRYHEVWQLAIGSYNHSAKGCESCPDIGSAPTTALNHNASQSLTFSAPPAAITQNPQGFDLQITCSATCGQIRDGKTDCGWAKARFEGLGAQLVKLSRDGKDDTTEKEGVSCGDLPGGSRNLSTTGIYHFDTESLPDEFDILQIGSGAGIAGRFHYCKGGVCKSGRR